MAERLTGNQGTISISGAAVNGTLRDWERTIEADTADCTGCGDTWEHSEVTFKKWEITAKYILPYSAYTSYGSIVGTEATIALVAKSGDSNYFSGDGWIVEDTVHLVHDDVVEGTLRIKGNGDAPTTF